MYDRITKKDILRMEEEINHRKLVVRKEALEDVKAAREHGDLSENFEYKAAKQFKNQNESRIRYLQNMIKTALVIEEDSNLDEIGLNDKVTLYNVDDMEIEVYKIVTTVRTNTLEGLISIESPLGKALLKHKVGDEVVVKISEAYSYTVRIEDIEKLCDDGSDPLLRF